MQNTIRYALFLFIVSGLLLGGCGEKTQVEVDTTTEDQTTSDTSNNSDNGTTTVTDTTSTEQSSQYTDGTYSATGNYASPAGMDAIGVTITIKDDVVTSMLLQNKANDPTSKQFVDLFISGVDGVVGKSLNEIGKFTSVNGASLTPIGFEEALADIKSQAS